MSFSLRAAAVLAAAVLAACAAPLSPPPAAVESDSAELRREAAAVFAADGAAEPLFLSEKISENIESLAADGTVNAYKVHYVLSFRWRGEERDIALEQIVSVDESRYLAGIRSREEAAAQLRREALRRARYILAKLQ